MRGANPRPHHEIPNGRFDSGSMAEGWCDGVTVRVRLICSGTDDDSRITWGRTRPVGMVRFTLIGQRFHMMRWRNRHILRGKEMVASDGKYEGRY